MQTFKEIPFQNYIELKFNSKNLNELAQQEALIKYKRNAQLLAEIFTFQNKKGEVYKSEDCVTQEQINDLSKQIKSQELANEQEIQEVRKVSKIYQEVNANIKEINSKEELFNIIDSLKQNGLYDECHPYFVQSSPFYLSTTEEDYLEVTKSEEFTDQGLSLLQIN